MKHCPQRRDDLRVRIYIYEYLKMKRNSSWFVNKTNNSKYDLHLFTIKQHLHQHFMQNVDVIRQLRIAQAFAFYVSWYPLRKFFKALIFLTALIQISCKTLKVVSIWFLTLEKIRHIHLSSESTLWWRLSKNLKYAIERWCHPIHEVFCFLKINGRH